LVCSARSGMNFFTALATGRSSSAMIRRDRRLIGADQLSGGLRTHVVAEIHQCGSADSVPRRCPRPTSIVIPFDESRNVRHEYAGLFGAEASSLARKWSFGE
jgi:hypothetical protein